MSEASLSPPARTSTTAPPLEVLAERIEKELARLAETRPHLEDRIGRAAQLIVVQLSSCPRNRPLRCRIRQGGRRVLLVSSLSSAGAVYEVDPVSWSCSCPDHHRRGAACKHALAGWVLWKTSLPSREIEGHIERGRGIITRTGAANEWTQAPAEEQTTSKDRQGDEDDREGGDEGDGSQVAVPRVYTARYAASGLLSSGKLVPVRISMFPPIIPLGYEVAEEVRDLEPERSMLGEWKHYSTEYWRKLDAIGPERIARQLSAISGRHLGKPLALLCYEDLTSSDRCHRAVLAFWWYEQTGLEMPEITDDGELLGLHDLHRQTMPVVPRSVVPR